jgi:hypothetical protein
MKKDIDVEEAKVLLKETMMALCDYRTIHGRCAQCNDAMFCRAKKVIPQIEKFVGIRK